MESLHCSAGVYVHIPFCQRKCPYCAFYSVPLEQADPERFSAALRKEIQQYSVTEPVRTVYIGGGSPSCLPAEVLVGLVRAMAERFGAVEEFTVECNPAQANEDTLKRLRASGVNRISIGAQSFDPANLQMLGRLHTPQQAKDAVQAAKRAGFDNIGLDLIFGVPGSAIASWRDSLRAAIDLNVRHISAYSLTIEQATPFDRAVKEGTLSLVDEQTDRAMHEIARRTLQNAGFVQYEISNFARPGFECRHNIRYWKNLPVVGIGPAAASWYRGVRTTNAADVDAYISAIEAGRFAYSDQQKPSPEQMARETAVLNLRMTDGIDLAEFQHQTGFNALELFDGAIALHTRSGLLEQTPTHLRLTEKGLSFADTVACDFS
ncbi:MAG: radical SAM family heme chaperone HemW [Planctomycetales bacterium]|nr:radical SAM family heme chaperone HemW [Planctomycetales bacterium]